MTLLSVERLQAPNGAIVSFEVEVGHCLALRGPSGSGKSLILHAIADLDVVHGEVRVGHKLLRETPAPEWRRRTCYLPAVPSFWTDTGRAALDGTADVAESLGLTDRLDAPITELSSGERQRVGICRALMGKPNVLLADEPTSALDDVAAGRVEAALRRYMADGGILVLVSHDADLVSRMADTIVDVVKP